MKFSKLNENIKAIADQAGVTIDGMGYGEGNIEKFAELIIRECARIVEEFGTDVENGDIFRLAKYKNLSDDIKKGHIGTIAWEGAVRVKEHFE